MLDIPIEQNTWLFMATGASLFYALDQLCNEYFKVKGIYLVFWRSFIFLLLLSPVLITLSIPTDPVFYIALSIAGLATIYADTLMYKISAEQGGGVLSRLKPLSLPIVYLVWFIISPETFFTLLDSPWKLAGITISISLLTFFLLKLKECKITYSALKVFAPILICNAIITLSNKISMDHSPLHSGVYAYMFFQAILTFVISLSIIYIKDRTYKNLINKNVIKAGISISIILGLYVVLKNYASALVIHPAFADAIKFSAILWVSLIYRIIGHKEQANVTNGYGLVFSIFLLILFTNL